MNFAEMNAEQLEARLEELTAETSEEKRDALDNDALEARIQEMEAITAELENRKKAAAEEERQAEEAARKQGEQIIKTKEERKMEINSMEYRDLWIRNLQGKLNEEETRAYASVDDHNAVPTYVADKMFEKMKKLAPMLSEITLMRVAGNLKFIAEGVRNSADSKHTENSAIAASDDTIVSVTLGGYEFLKVIQISRTAKMMSVDAFENWLVEMLAGDIARAIDNYILNDSTNGVNAIAFTTTTQIINTAATGYTYIHFFSLLS